MLPGCSLDAETENTPSISTGKCPAALWVLRT